MPLPIRPDDAPPPGLPFEEGERLTALRLVDFRNYASLSLPVERRFVVLSGDNGAGKTNLLEAVSLLTPGRGLRRASYGEMARQGGGGGFSIRASLAGAAGQTDVATLVRPDAGAGVSRIVRIEETQARSADELLDLLRILWLTPAMDALFTGPAGGRRRFLDRLVLSVDPEHGRRAADYERAMRGRNRLLADNRMDDAWLGGLEAQMAELGVAIAFARDHLVDMLRSIVDHSSREGPFPKADLELYSGYDIADSSRAAVEIEDEVRARLRRDRGQDRTAGRTLEGSHRAELRVSHRAKSMPAALSSTGEQKGLLIGLVLAHARLVRRVAGMAPVLLLDEIAAHLDAGRRAALFDLIDELGVQAFMTGTDANLFESLGERAQMLDIRNGTMA